jgi:hypothetical protein
MRSLYFLLFACCAAFGADSDYNGRWDITAHTKPRPRAWWVELKGVGSSNPSGKFVSAYAGDMNNIDSISVENGLLKFVIKRPSRPNNTPANIVYTARLVNGKLEGTQMVEGQKNAPLEWSAVRAPAIKDKDDGTWKEGKPVALFNGKDLTGWKGLVPNAEVKWTVEDGVLKNAPPTTDIISDQSFWNYKLHVEFRIREHSNSGIGLRGRYEIQILDDYGKPAGTHGAAALYSRIAPSENASKPAGEWQTYDIRLVGRTLTVVHNGKKVLDKVEIEGLTAIATNPDEGEPGPFILQGDHSFVEIKSFVVTPLTH